jgi:hypothetical protein
VSEIVDALNASYTGPKGPSLKAMEFAEQYRADTVFKKYWEPTLKAILSGKEPV